MNDISREQPIPPAEIARAEAQLTPKQRVMNRVRANILAPLGYVRLPESQVKIIYGYAEKASRVAGREYERLQKESPVGRLLDALEEELYIVRGNEKGEGIVENAIFGVRSQVEKWQDNFTEAQGLAVIRGETKTLEEIVIDQIEVARQEEKDRVSWIDRGGIRPLIVFDMATVQAGERLLKETGFLPEQGSLQSLFASPEYQFAGRLHLTDSDIEELRWGKWPISQGKVTGLQSDLMPGVFAQVGEVGRNMIIVLLNFTPPAVTKSVAMVPSITVT